MKTALITGASRGIGKAIALKLAETHSLILTGRNRKRLAEVQAACEAEGTSVQTVAADLSIPADVEKLFMTVDQLDLLINNAGMGIFKPIGKTTLADWKKIQQVNVEGAFLCIQAAMKIMTAQGGGRIINISSVVGVKGYPKQAAYGASKHALLGLTKTAIEEGRNANIRVHAICPGGVATDLLRKSRPDLNEFSAMIQPEDVANAVCYLNSLPPNITVDVIYLRRSASSQMWG
ncbi:MAG: SDR family oxidoreductase [Kiritimatiellia bacterium]